MSIRALIVEDEPLAREKLRGWVSAEPELEVVAECGDGRDAVSRIRELRPDLVFLDIQLPELDGFGVLAALGAETPPVVIFTTAYDKFALRAFEVHALDYLLKPFDRDRFRDAVRRAKDRLAKPAPSEGLRELLAELRPEAKPAIKRLTVKSVGSVTFVDLDQIDWLESADNYVNIHTATGERLIRETLAALEERLPAEEFVRISRSTIVALDRVKELQPLTNGGCTVILRNGTHLTLSRGYRDKLPVLKGEPA